MLPLAYSPSPPSRRLTSVPTHSPPTTSATQLSQTSPPWVHSGCQRHLCMLPALRFCTGAAAQLSTCPAGAYCPVSQFYALPGWLLLSSHVARAATRPRCGAGRQRRPWPTLQLHQPLPPPLLPPPPPLPPLPPPLTCVAAAPLTCAASATPPFPWCAVAGRLLALDQLAAVVSPLCGAALRPSPPIGNARGLLTANSIRLPAALDLQAAPP